MTQHVWQRLLPRGRKATHSYFGGLAVPRFLQLPPLVGVLAASVACAGTANDSEGGGAVGAGAGANHAAGGTNAGSASGSGGDGTGSVGGMGSGSGVVTNPDGTMTDCSTVTRPATPLRRLTRFEYNNTVRDLLGTSLTPADAFPQDEVADGFSNNALVLTISSLHAERYTVASEALAAEAVTRLPDLLPCDPAVSGETACAEQFARSFGTRAFRRALEPEDVATLMEAYALGATFEEGIEVMIRAALQSPHFLFRVEFSGSQPNPEAPEAMVRLNGYETATRLSYLIWSSMPDEQLLSLAESGELSTPAQVAAAARRLLADPRARNAVGEFYRQWLELTRLDQISKDVVAFPLWSETMRQALKDEGDAVIEAVVFGETPTLEQLLRAPLGLPTGPLADLYGIAESDQVASLPADQRSGILTLPGFLSVQAHPDQTSPVLRGQFIRARLLCTDVPPPPDDVDISVPEISEGATARERFSAHAEGRCASCHDLMDPLGYTFENFDAMGEYRTTDNGAAIDVSGRFIATDDIDGAFDDIHQMATTLAGSQQVQSCMATQWFKYAMGRGTEAGDACSLQPLQETFTQGGTNLNQLLIDLTQTEAFLSRRVAKDEVSP